MIIGPMMAYFKGEVARLMLLPPEQVKKKLLLWLAGKRGAMPGWSLDRFLRLAEKIMGGPSWCCTDIVEAFLWPGDGPRLSQC